MGTDCGCRRDESVFDGSCSISWLIFFVCARARVLKAPSAIHQKRLNLFWCNTKSTIFGTALRGFLLAMIQFHSLVEFLTFSLLPSCYLGAPLSVEGDTSNMNMKRKRRGKRRKKKGRRRRRRRNGNCSGRMMRKSDCHWWTDDSISPSGSEGDSE